MLRNTDANNKNRPDKKKCCWFIYHLFVSISKRFDIYVDFIGSNRVGDYIVVDYNFITNTWNHSFIEKSPTTHSHGNPQPTIKIKNNHIILIPTILLSCPKQSNQKKEVSSTP